jgi:photosystem II stability/assembly factor-like uncharacterized protein
MRAPNQATTAVISLFHDTTGVPLVGIGAADITLSLHYPGTSPQLKSVDGTNFREVDATNMPGIYEVDLEASDVAMSGELLLVVAANGGENLAQATSILQVGITTDQLLNSASRTQLETNLPVSTAQTVAGYFEFQGQPQLGLGSTSLTSLLLKRGVITANTVASTLSEINSSTLPGWYTFTLGVGDTDTEGDLLVQFEAQGSSLTAGSQPILGTAGSTEVRSIYAQNSTDVFFTHSDGLSDAYAFEFTTNAGATWTVDSDIAAKFSVDGLPETLFYAFGSVDSGQPFIIYTTDDGANYTFASEGTFTIFEPVIDVSVATTNDVFGVTASGVLHLDIATNAGALPIIFQVGDIGTGTETLRALHALDASTVIVVGFDTTSPFVMRTLNAGSTWTEITPSGSPNQIYGVDFLAGTSTGWIVGAGGYIAKSTDGGATFTAQTSGTVADLHDVYVQDANTAWAVGNSVIRYTYDGGTTWETDAALTGVSGFRNYFSVNGFDNVIWAGGTTDGSPTLVRIEATQGDLQTTSFRFQVESASVDFTDIETTLTAIQGAGFDTVTNSLVAQTAQNTAVASSLGDVVSDLEGVTTDLTEIQETLRRILGLTQENIRITNHIYDGGGNLTSAQITLYPTAADVAAETNAIATYALEASYNGDNRLTDYSIRRA